MLTFIVVLLFSFFGKTLMHYFNVFFFWKACWKIFSKLNIFLKSTKVFYLNQKYILSLYWCVYCFIISVACHLVGDNDYWQVYMMIDRFILKSCLVFVKFSMLQGHWNTYRSILLKKILCLRIALCLRIVLIREFLNLGS